MRVQIDLFRAADGRLEGIVHIPDAGQATFGGVLDLLRVFEGIELCRPPPDPDRTDPDRTDPDPTDRKDGDA